MKSHFVILCNTYIFLNIFNKSLFYQLMIYYLLRSS